MSETPEKKKRGRPRKRGPIEASGPSVRDALLSMPVAADPLAKRGPHGPQKRPRKTTKKQVSVRIDEQLLETATRRAQNQQLSLTDAIEQGLWLYLADEREPATTQLRFLVSALPLQLQKRLLSCAAFMISKELGPVEERAKAYFCQVFDYFGQDARAQAAIESLRQPQA